MAPSTKKTPLSKRLFDLGFSCVTIVILSPILLLISLLILWIDGTPLLFCQDRPGLNGKIFRVYKFRTMKNAQEKAGKPMGDRERITPLGRILRRLSLDELPELVNVLKGEMSIVGPRPLLVQYLDRYSPKQSRRHEVLPGITGWAQVNGRNAINWEEKFQYDVWYVDHWSFWLDIRIILITIWKALKGEGISQPGMATMEEFQGSQKKR